MIAKILNKLTMFVAIMATTFSVLAEPQTANTSANGSAALNRLSHYPKTKRMPSGNVLEVVYTDGILTLESNFYEGPFSLSFENNETGEIYEVSAIYVGQSVPLELKCGEYQVNAIGEDGCVLSGFMQIY